MTVVASYEHLQYTSKAIVDLIIIMSFRIGNISRIPLVKLSKGHGLSMTFTLAPKKIEFTLVSDTCMLDRMSPPTMET